MGSAKKAASARVPQAASEGSEGQTALTGQQGAGPADGGRHGGRRRLQQQLAQVAAGQQRRGTTRRHQRVQEGGDASGVVDAQLVRARLEQRFGPIPGACLHLVAAQANVVCRMVDS